MTPRRGFVLLAALVLLGLSQSTGISPTAARAQKQPPKITREHEAWRLAMQKLRVPPNGCFKAAFPAVKWIRVTCGTPPKRPYPPVRGHRPFTVGNGNDFSGRVTASSISGAEGSFDSVSTGISETGAGGGANVYSLQINTNFFTTSVCSGSPNPGCRGWEQFLYSSNAGSIFIQYWLIRYNAACPAGGWITFMFPGSTDIYCFRNGAGSSPVARQAITTANLPTLRLNGSATTGGNDTVTMFFAGTNASAANLNSILNLGPGWTDAEFTIVGDGNGSEATFNANATIVVRTTVHHGSTSAPTCQLEGFTGETNNLNLVGTAVVGTGPSPAIVSRQSNAPGTAASCQAATGLGDTHLTTFNGLLYDYQAAGDFVLAQTGPDFLVQARQVSGAPTWPNASVNRAVAARIGGTRVAVCLPNQLAVNGKAAAVSVGSPLVLPNGVDISRYAGNVYLIRGPHGDSVRAQVNNGWIDVSVGLGRWPVNVRGLLANANGNVNQLATSGGAVLTVPLSFKDLYFRYGDSWRVRPGQALLCGKQVKPSKPTRPFYAKDLEPAVAQRTRAICLKAGVKRGPLLDACTLDVAVIGRAAAAKVYVGAPAPAAVAIPR